MKTRPLYFIVLLLGLFGCKSSNGPIQTTSLLPGDSAICDTLHVYRFSNICAYFEGYYNPKKHSPEQTINTVNLCLQIGTSAIVNNRDVFEPADTLQLSLDSLEKEYKERLVVLQPGKIIPNPKWERLRKIRIKEVQAEYEFQKIYISAWKNPEVLRKTSLSNSCEKYVNALCSRDTSIILDAWRSFVKEQAVSNDYALKKYEKEYNSTSDRLLYAKIDLMTFAWSNCANGSVYHSNAKEVQLDLEKEFRDIFTMIKVNALGCD